MSVICRKGRKTTKTHSHNNAVKYFQFSTNSNSPPPPRPTSVRKKNITLRMTPAGSVDNIRGNKSSNKDNQPTRFHTRVPQEKKKNGSPPEAPTSTKALETPSHVDIACYGTTLVVPTTGTHYAVSKKKKKRRKKKYISARKYNREDETQPGEVSTTGRRHMCPSLPNAQTRWTETASPEWTPPHE